MPIENMPTVAKNVGGHGEEYNNGYENNPKSIGMSMEEFEATTDEQAERHLQSHMGGHGSDYNGMTNLTAPLTGWQALKYGRLATSEESEVTVPRYERITRFIPGLERASTEAEFEKVSRQLSCACYKPSPLDQRYRNTLEERGLGKGRFWTANVEELDAAGCVAILVALDRAVRGMYDTSAKTPLQFACESGFVTRLLYRIAEVDGTWKRSNVVTFYHEYDKCGYMSNWFSSQYSFGGHEFPTSEHWMMWQKARVFGDDATAAAVLEADSPAEVKSLGRGVKPYRDSIWHDACLPLMRVGLRQKFVQNERLLNSLLSTGSAVLAEASQKDGTWGVGLGEDDPRLSNPAEWRGQNLLGRSLMGVRSDLRSLASLGKEYEWPIDALRNSHVWDMSLLELARVPSTREAALMYAAVVAQSAPGHFRGVRDVIREIGTTIGDIEELMQANEDAGIPTAGWQELLDELALQLKLGFIC